MNSSCRTRAARTAFTLAVAALTLPLNARGAEFAHSQHHRADRSDADDEGLLFSDNPVILTNHSDRAWMEFKTDPCGTLLRVENHRSIVTRSGLSDDLEGLGDDDDDDDPADLGREMVGTWLSQHPQIAVINDGVDKGCESGWYDDEELPGDFQAKRIFENRGNLPGTKNASPIA